MGLPEPGLAPKRLTTKIEISSCPHFLAITDKNLNDKNIGGWLVPQRVFLVLGAFFGRKMGAGRFIELVLGYALRVLGAWFRYACDWLEADFLLVFLESLV